MHGYRNSVIGCEEFAELLEVVQGLWRQVSITAYVGGLSYEKQFIAVVSILGNDQIRRLPRVWENLN